MADVIDPALRRSGRFDTEIEVTIPNEDERFQILKFYTKKLPLDPSVDLRSIAASCNGCVGADLEALCREAAMSAVRKSSDANEEAGMRSLTMDDWKHARSAVGPSITRGVTVEIPMVSWEDIGGLKNLKKKLQQAVEWPLKHSAAFSRLGVSPVCGILLHGPPGCSKTTLAKAAAHAAQASFFSLSGAKLYSTYVGEGEALLHNTFWRAHLAALSIIFFDEADVVAAKRGGKSSSNITVGERLLSTLLTEMDGLKQAKGILVLAATNRPHAIDAALMRPGCFDLSPLLSNDVDLKQIAEDTELFTGAELEGLCREARIVALREDISASVTDLRLERVLEVKKATKDRCTRFEQSRREPHSISRPPEPISYRAEVPYSGQRSFAEVLKGVTPTVARKDILSIKANEEDLGWLHGSVIVRLNSEFSNINIGNVLKEKGLDHVLVKKRGGRVIVLTFKSKEELKSNICNIKEWFKEWSQFVMEWKPGLYLEQERCVWLRCYGIPLNLWNRGTLNNIGSMWGTVLSLDGDICRPKSFSYTRIRVATSCMEFINKTISLDCKGKLHPILCSSNEIYGSVVERTSPKECFREKEADHVMEVNTIVEESKWDEGLIRVEEVCTKEVDQRTGSNDCHLGEEVNTVVEETILEESVHNPNCIVEQVSTPGFIKSFSGSRDGSGFGINLEMDLAFSKNLNRKGFLSINQSGLVKQPTSVPKLLRNEKRKRKKKVQLEGFTSFARLHGQKAAAVSKHTSRSVIFRPIAAAIARSDLSEGVTSPNNLFLNEAKATTQLGKSFGINFNRKEDDVLNKIIKLELKDKERSK
ncbi:unnamed protein product [Camellia sinensis]